MSPPARDPARDAAIQAVVDGTLADPHAVLGAHPVSGGVVVRAFRPEAVAVRGRGLEQRWG